MGEAGDTARETVPRTWRTHGVLSSSAHKFEAFLEAAEFDRGPWLTVAFGCGIGLWFYLAAPWQWVAMISAFLGMAVLSWAGWRHQPGRAFTLAAVISLSLAVAAGVSVVWVRSAIVGAEPIAYPRFERIDGRVLSREEQPAEDRVRLVLAARDGETGKAHAYRVNVPLSADSPELREGARVRLSARLMPPSPPIVPGAYNFAIRAWFDGLAATGSAVGDVEIVEPPGAPRLSIASAQRQLSRHVRANLEGTSGAIAATLASGDRGAIPEADEEAMRDSGLTHLLSISGLHVSAIIAATYFIVLKLLAFWPWLTLRIRLPLVAAGASAIAGIAYTLLTGAEVPPVRSCIGALLVLVALAVGREPLSMRMIAVAAAQLGYRTHIFAPEESGPAADVSPNWTRGAYADAQALAAFADSVDVVTYEFENIDPSAVDTLARHGLVRPGAEALRVAQDRLAEKRFVCDLGGLTAPFAPVESLDDLESAVETIGSRAILKTNRMGYDGKGQARLSEPGDAVGAWNAIGRQSAILEGFVTFAEEFSVILVRGADGAMRFWDSPANVHVNGILSTSTAPAGALIEGLWNVPPGTSFSIELAERLVVQATARWSKDDRMGVAFDRPIDQATLRPPARSVAS